MDFVGPSVGEELVTHGLTAVILVCVGIMLYLAIRFEWRFAVAAIIANMHDVVIILGCFAFFRWEFSLTVLAGILAVLGYSVNESVVVFDRIRENFRKPGMRGHAVAEVIDNAITSTMSRTIITHFSTEMMVVSMLVFGGPALHGFAMALTIGIVFGIYSSVLVASPIALWLGVKREHMIKPVKQKRKRWSDHRLLNDWPARPASFASAHLAHNGNHGSHHLSDRLHPAHRRPPDPAGGRLRPLGLRHPVPDRVLRDRPGGHPPSCPATRCCSSPARWRRWAR